MFTNLMKIGRTPAQYACAFVFATLMAESASAEPSGVDVVNNGKEFVNSIGSFLQISFLVAGIGAAGWGVYAATIGRKKREQKEEGVGIPIAAILGGMLLAGLIYTMGTVSQTVFGSNAMDTGLLNNGFQN